MIYTERAFRIVRVIGIAEMVLGIYFFLINL